MTTPIRVISTAIKTRRVIQFRYRVLMRQVEPHALGYDKRGHLMLCGWQVTGLNRGWQFYPLARLSGLSITDMHFDEPRQGCSANDSMSQILAHL